MGPQNFVKGKIVTESPRDTTGLAKTESTVGVEGSGSGFVSLATQSLTGKEKPTTNKGEY